MLVDAGGMVAVLGKDVGRDAEVVLVGRGRGTVFVVDQRLGGVTPPVGGRAVKTGAIDILQVGGAAAMGAAAAVAAHAVGRHGQVFSAVRCFDMLLPEKKRTFSQYVS